MSRMTCIATLFDSASLSGTLTRLLPELTLVPFPTNRANPDYGALAVEVGAKGEDALTSLGRLSKKLKGQPPVVALSRSADPEEIARILGAGVYDCVPFPLEVQRLRHALRRAAEHGALKRKLRARVPAVAGLPTLELARLERLAIEEALRETRMNFEAAAKILGLGRSTLYRRVPDLVQAVAAAASAARARSNRRRSTRPTA